ASGKASNQTESHLRWGRATTAHQAAEPRMHDGTLLAQSRRGAFFVVVGLIGFALIIVFSSRASESMTNLTEVSSPQEQMQFPEGLDYSKFQHTSRNHSRLPCLLCHRRDTNAPIPKRPGASNHLPCSGCHAQQFSNSDGPIWPFCHTDGKSAALQSCPRP